MDDFAVDAAYVSVAYTKKTLQYGRNTVMWFFLCTMVDFLWSSKEWKDESQFRLLSKLSATNK